MSTITNTRQKLASLCPSDTTEVQLYVVPASTEIDGLLRVVNLDTVEHTYSVAHCDAGHGDNNANDSDFMPYNCTVSANTMHEISIHAGPTETIRVTSGSSSNVSFHLSGNKKVSS